MEIVSAFSEVNHVDVPYEIAPRRDGDIASCYADASKAKDVLDWSCTYNIEDMVKDSYNYVKNTWDFSDEMLIRRQIIDIRNIFDNIIQAKYSLVDKQEFDCALNDSLLRLGVMF